MWNKPGKEQLAKIPRLYNTEKIDGNDKLIYLHFFIGGCDWYIAEFDGEDLLFGFAILNDPQNAEWGYFSLSELAERNINGVEIDTDLHWQPKEFLEINCIREAVRKLIKSNSSWEKTIPGSKRIGDLFFYRI